jgi:hypothetical protein
MTAAVVILLVAVGLLAVLVAALLRNQSALTRASTSTPEPAPRQEPAPRRGPVSMAARAHMRGRASSVRRRRPVPISSGGRRRRSAVPTPTGGRSTGPGGTGTAACWPS